MKTLKDFDFKGKKVLVRCDFNVPLIGGRVQDDFRIKATLPTIKFLAKKGAKLLLMSHLEDAEGKNLSLAPVKTKLEEYLGTPILMAEDCVGKEVEDKISKMKSGQILLLENLRFHKEEKENNLEFAKNLAKLGDIYINDAFSVSHRPHASVVGIPKILPSCAGFLFEKEIKILSEVLKNPKKPLVAIIGGAKIANKAKMIKNFLEKGEHVLLGGKIANTILQLKGIYKDSALTKDDLSENVKNISLTSTKLHIPLDAIVSFNEKATGCVRTAPVGKLEKGELILDIGPETISVFSKIIKEAKTLVWSGPLGLFEEPLFENGTKKIAKALAENKNAYKIVGGGDTISAVSKFNLLDKFDHVSTGGGAMLEFLGGKELPGIEALKMVKKLPSIDK